MKEEAVLFGEKKSLVGILTDPPSGRSGLADVAVILLNPGVVHRVGPGRIYVKIARELASLGFTALRFDFSGIGDSQSRPDNLPFDKSSVDEAQSAMDFLETKRGVTRFILTGGCSGARVSFAAACCDRRVSGVMLMNFPPVAEDDVEPNRSPEQQHDPKNGRQGDAQKDARYYFDRAVVNGRSWQRFFTGEADYRKIAAALSLTFRRRIAPRKTAVPPEWLVFRRNLDSLVEGEVRPVFVYAEGDAGLRDLREAGGRRLAELCSRGKVDLALIPRSDHTFSSLFDQERLVKVLREKALEIARGVRSLASASCKILFASRSHIRRFM